MSPVSLSLFSVNRIPLLTTPHRLTYGVCTRLQRIADVDLQFNEWTIPAGTPVGMSSALVNKDPSIWPEPLKFRPERWLDPDESARLYKYMVSFTKGSRSCLGIK